ncbi:MAG: chemotaxis protein CheB [Polyangiales bacterium]
MTNTREPSAEFSVVGVGASAGGITALQGLLRSLPARCNLAFVIVQHSLPERRHELHDLFAKWSALPVRLAGDDTPIARDHVYLAAPGQKVTVAQGKLVARPLDGADRRTGTSLIDALFESLARELGPRAVAVLLSGSGHDGAAGAVAVKQAGGMVMVQDPITALHDDMPHAAMAAGVVDRILPVNALAEELVASATPTYIRPGVSRFWASDLKRALDGIIDLIRKHVGFDLTGYKTVPLLWRIQHRMDVRGVSVFRDYEALLLDDVTELAELIRNIPIHVTEFFRDEAAWHALRTDAIQPLQAEANGRALRVWTPGCATGEEAYSVAMLLAEAADLAVRPVDFQVFATDASSDIVTRASRGSFKQRSVGKLSPARRERFFYAADNVLRVKRSLRDKLVFAPHDLLVDPPFTSLDLVTCRNVLIYLEREAAERVISLLNMSLRMGGYLFLGTGETLIHKHHGFALVSASAHLYRKVAPAPEVPLDVPKRPSFMRSATASRVAIETRAHMALLERDTVPTVLVDDELRMLRVYGDTQPFLRFSPGRPSLSLLDLVPPVMAVELDRAVKLAQADQSTQTVATLEDPITHALSLSVKVTPVAGPDSQENTYLVSFIRGASSGARSTRGATASVAPSEQQNASIADWREVLRVSHEELEASREELMALNEELKTSNEQLNDANDDLHDVNLQLSTKLDEIETQHQVLSSGAVMTLFLDEDQRVRWFTAAVSRLLPLKSVDIGRSIADIARRFSDEHFADDVHGVMHEQEPREAEVRAMDGAWYLRRVRPHRSSTGGMSGVAITFTDITERKHAELVLRESEERQGFLLQLSDALRALPDPVRTQREAMRLLAVQLGVMRAAYFEMDDDQDGFVQTTGHEADTAPLPAHMRVSDYGSETAQAFRAGTTVAEVDARSDAHPEPYRRAFQAIGVCAWVGVPLVKGKRLVAMLAVHHATRRDWSAAEILLLEAVAERTWAALERSRTETALRESEEKYRSLFDTMAEGFAICAVVRNDAGRVIDFSYTELNRALEQHTGLCRRELVGRRFSDVFAPADAARWMPIYTRAAEAGEPITFEQCASPVDRWFEVSVNPRGADQLLLFFRDVTARKHAELALKARDDWRRQRSPTQ